jgi:hypothetical protein
MCSLFSVSLQLRKRRIATEINSIPNSRLDKGKCRTANFRLTCVEVLVDMLGVTECPRVSSNLWEVTGKLTSLQHSLLAREGGPVNRRRSLERALL